MLKLTVLFVCFAAALGGRINDRIVGGNPAKPGQFPYQVSMRLTKFNSHHCGGTIITSRFIVTAAHCVYQHELSEFFIVVGTNTLSDGGQAYGLENMAYHNNWTPKTAANDIAVLKTMLDIQFNSLVSPLPIADSETPVGSKLVLSGWGYTSMDGSSGTPNDLQYISLTSINNNDCSRALTPVIISPTQICTFTRYGQGSCQGDSGGPLVYNGELVGIVSWGRPCAIGYPDVFTKVAAYVDWLQDIVENM